MRSSVATRYQVGLVLQAGSLTAPPSTSTPQGIWESAMNWALSDSTYQHHWAGGLRTANGGTRRPTSS
jgi:hypothetical protein